MKRLLVAGAPQDVVSKVVDMLNITTLETQFSDSSDFHDLSVSSIKSIVDFAYNQGYEAGRKVD